MLCLFKCIIYNLIRKLENFCFDCFVLCSWSSFDIILIITSYWTRISSLVLVLVTRSYAGFVMKLWSLLCFLFIQIKLPVIFTVVRAEIFVTAMQWMNFLSDKKNQLIVVNVCEHTTRITGVLHLNYKSILVKGGCTSVLL